MLPGKVLLLAFAATSGRHYPLPASAVVKVGGGYVESVNRDRTGCDSVKLTPNQVRRYFRTFHRVEGAELHDGYLIASCGVQGTVVVSGKEFHWKYDAGNTMVTDYPDGVERRLGGKHTGDVGSP